MRTGTRTECPSEHKQDIEAGDETGAQGDDKILESTASANNIGQRQEVVKAASG